MPVLIMGSIAAGMATALGISQQIGTLRPDHPRILAKRQVSVRVEAKPLRFATIDSRGRIIRMTDPPTPHLPPSPPRAQEEYDETLRRILVKRLGF